MLLEGFWMGNLMLDIDNVDDSCIDVWLFFFGRLLAGRPFFNGQGQSVPSASFFFFFFLILFFIFFYLSTVYDTL